MREKDDKMCRKDDNKCYLKMIFDHNSLNRAKKIVVGNLEFLFRVLVMSHIFLE